METASSKGVSFAPMLAMDIAWLLTVSMTLGLIAAWASPALAEETNVVVSQGSLVLSGTPTIADFMLVRLDGSPQQTEAAFDDFSVVDGRGNGAGWTVTVEATQFRQWNGTAYVVGGRALPRGSLAMPSPSVAAAGTESAPPEVAAGPLYIDGGSVVLARAAESTGMGSYLFRTPDPLVLTVPASAYAGTYRSELSVSVVSGP